MAWIAPFTAAAGVMTVAYLCWPLVGLNAILDAIARRNVVQLRELTDVHELKQSLATQLVTTYLQLNNKEKKLSPLAQQFALQAGVKIADAYVSELAEFENLIVMLRRPSIETVAGPAVGGVRGTIYNAENFFSYKYRGVRFSAPLSPQGSDSKKYHVHLKLSDWRWKLTGIDLPEDIRHGLVRAFQNSGGKIPNY